MMKGYYNTQLENTENIGSLTRKQIRVWQTKDKNRKQSKAKVHKR